jgi:hypothetical protein
MSDSSASSGLGDLLALFGGANPLAGVSRSFAQMQKGVADFLQAVENLNAITARVNRLLDDVEPPIRALMPQITRSITLMDTWSEQLSAPIERVAPGLARLADTLSSPVLSALPKDLSSFVEALGDLARRMQPLGQIAETAGGLFSMNPLANFFGGARSDPTPAPPPPPPPVKQSPSAKAGVQRAKPAAKRAPAKKAAAKKPTKR